jgi:hypothetical protein
MKRSSPPVHALTHYHLYIADIYSGLWCPPAGLCIYELPDCRRKRAMPIAREQISVVIDGKSIVEACTKRRLPPNSSNSPPTRKSQDS